MTGLSSAKWRNPSVLEASLGSDPIKGIQRRARNVALSAMDKGWVGPPFDPLMLSKYLGIDAIPSEDVRDAVLVQVSGKPVIHYNPNKPIARVRYSVAHEIGHTLFPDYLDRPRYRHKPSSDDESCEWELELLCNMAAAEFLMPLGSLKEDVSEGITIGLLMELRKKYGVSFEAILIRVASLTRLPIAAFSASPTTSDSDEYALDYFIPSSAWTGARLLKGAVIGTSNAMSDCGAIGHTSRRVESWTEGAGEYLVECVGLPPIPGKRLPRVAGFVSTPDVERPTLNPSYLFGNALDPKGYGRKIIAHVVNDRAKSWAPVGFASQLKKKFPKAHSEYRRYVKECPSFHKLGGLHIVEVDDELFIASLMAQRGYGGAPGRRLVYSALLESLEELSNIAAIKDASVHMPRIGAGVAGGNWDVIEQIVRSTLAAHSVDVTVYDLP